MGEKSKSKRTSFIGTAGGYVYTCFETRAHQKRPAVANRGQILHFVTPYNLGRSE